jgi:cytochrome P450
MSDSISFADPAVQRCPFAAYDALRAEQPVYRDPLTGNYVLTRYEDVRRALLNPKVLSNRTGLGAARSNPQVNAIYDAKGWRPMATLITNDPPDHRRYRVLVDKAFAFSKVEALEARMQQIVDGLIDALIDKTEVEFLADFAIRLPMIVIAEQLSVAPEDMDRFKLWSDLSVESMDPMLTPEREVEVVTELTAMQRYLAAAIERLRVTPDGSLLSHLVHVEFDGDRLEMGALQNILQQLLVAGNETTTMALAAGVKLLAETPSIAIALRETPALIRGFVEETLRIMAPIQTLFRRVTEDIDINGTLIPAGALVEVRFGAANRDPATYPDPGQVDLARTNASSHLAFGAGPHLCIGNQLARAELRVAFRSIIERMDKIRFSRGAASCVYTPLYISHGLTQLWIAFDTRGKSSPEALPQHAC